MNIVSVRRVTCFSSRCSSGFAWSARSATAGGNCGAGQSIGFCNSIRSSRWEPSDDQDPLRGPALGCVHHHATLFIGRFFCGWVCPFGALHQFTGWLGLADEETCRARGDESVPPGASDQVLRAHRHALRGGGDFRFTANGIAGPDSTAPSFVNLVVLTAIDGLGTAHRFYTGAWLIAAVFLAAVLLNLWIPRFYCRFVCPLGALFGLLTRWTPWRIGKRQGECSGCELCEGNCEGACDPFGKIRTSECLLCMNCLVACRQAQMDYGTNRSAAGEIESPALTRRGFLVAAHLGRRGGAGGPLEWLLDGNWNSNVVRPPGALAEEQFLERCLKCGQCMRACPTNVIQPATLEAGLEGIWTPVLNFRSGTSGCQLNCIACGNVCPDGGDPAGVPERKTRTRGICIRRANPHGHGVRRPRTLPALGDGGALHRLPGKLSRQSESDLPPRRIPGNPRWNARGHIRHCHHVAIRRRTAPARKTCDRRLFCAPRKRTPGGTQINHREHGQFH